MLTKRLGDVYSTGEEYTRFAQLQSLRLELLYIRMPAYAISDC